MHAGKKKNETKKEMNGLNELDSNGMHVFLCCFFYIAK